MKDRFNPFKVRSKRGFMTNQKEAELRFNPFKVRSKLSTSQSYRAICGRFNPFKVRSKRAGRNTGGEKEDAFQSLQGTIQTFVNLYNSAASTEVSIPSRYDPNADPCLRWKFYALTVSIPSRYDPNLPR